MTALILIRMAKEKKWTNLYLGEALQEFFLKAITKGDGPVNATGSLDKF